MSSRSQVVEKCVTFSKFSFFPSVLQWKKQKTSARKMDPHWVPFEQRYEFPHGKICKTGTSTGTGPKSQASQGLYNLLGGEVSSGVGALSPSPLRSWPTCPEHGEGTTGRKTSWGLWEEFPQRRGEIKGQGQKPPSS